MEGIPSDTPSPGYMGVSQNKGYHFGDPHNKDYSILGSILGSPYFGKPPYKNFKADVQSISNTISKSI